MIRRLLSRGGAVLIMGLVPSSAIADVPSSSHRSFRDRIGLDLAAGFGYGYSMRERTTGKDVADVRLLLVQPRLRIELADWSSRERWWAGRLDLVIEPELAINFVPETGVGGGITGGFRYLLLEDRKWSPYAIGTAGFGGIDYGLTAQDDGFEFFLQFGFGLRRELGVRREPGVRKEPGEGRALAEPRAVFGEVRMYHISNCQLHYPNDGIDAIAFLLGVEFR